ncbi:PLP-dependent aspartate aminotransferase family protein [Kocuria sp.]|uniref:trans-sulfuration enzyme family protein n=1 Tax=Kocuria sp. TaxID=1871328 RepID=UPI0026DB8264|nr:PLP-dependent aspartate aminotransferase family protein [Kocuria sp.]MDO4919251.1 PLP-dependent aspartate aminotransferase family protein [Kocuria sp.]
MHKDTVVVAAGRPDHSHDAPVNPPVVLTSTYRGVGAVAEGDRSYARSTNPTWEALEDVLARLEDAPCPALAYASGMAAITAVLTLVPVGGTLVLPRHSYQGSMQLARRWEQRGIFTVRTVDIADTGATLAALDGADMLWVESPTNPMLEIADLPVLLRGARERGVLSAVDNTFATPLLQRPLTLGADLVVHSATKYLAGHSDVLMGAVLCASEQLRSRLHSQRSLEGAIPGPFEAWLTLRGVRTLAVRVERSMASAAELARRAQDHPAVARVLYPGLPQDPGHERAVAQLRGGFGSVLALVPHDDAAAAERLVSRLRVWTPATSLGGVESLVERRRRHHDEPHSVPENLLRLSVGIENVEDLWQDLRAGLDALAGR